jgi:hypothetical protein
MRYWSPITLVAARLHPCCVYPPAAGSVVVLQDPGAPPGLLEWGERGCNRHPAEPPQRARAAISPIRVRASLGTSAPKSR